MRIRCCALLFAVSAAGLAQSTQDYFAKAFKQALPSPFTAPQMNRGGTLFIPPAPLEPPKILVQPRAFVVGPDQCAIPLGQTPISKDRQFLIRKLPLGGSSKMDPMAAPKIPVCRE